MGNAITKSYDLHKDFSATAGHCSLYKIWQARKKETAEEVSVWTFEKSDLSKRKPNPVNDKATQEQILQLMRKDLACLKECNCEGIIQIIEIIEDSKNAIVFTTERIVCSLADVLCRFESVPQNTADASYFDNGKTVSEMEISRGLLGLVEGLQYLHTVQKKLHLNIAPEAIVITAGGNWKFCSFGLSLAFQSGEGMAKIPSPYFLKSNPNSSVIRLEPDLRYSSLELTTGGFNWVGIRYLTPACDVFSLGILSYEVYRFNMQVVPHSSIIGVVNNNVQSHESCLTALTVLDFSFLDSHNSGLKEIIKGMLHMNAASRLKSDEISNHNFFVTGPLMCLRSIDTLATRDVGTQSAQLISLPQHMGTFPPRVLQRTVLPTICKICQSNPTLWVHAISIHIYLCDRMTSLKYKEIASKTVALGLAVTTPPEVMTAFLANIPWLLKTFDARFVDEHVVTLLCNALEKQNSNLQTIALQALCEEEVRAGLSSGSLTAKLVPKACKEACLNRDANVKIHALYFLALVCGELNKEFLVKNILPSLKYISDQDKNPMVSMCVIGNYEAIADAVGPEYIASSILPTIQPMLVDRSLSKQQFTFIVNLTRSMLKRVVKMRTDEIGMAPIDFSIEPEHQGLDPFSSAKSLLAAAKKTSTSFTHTSSSPSYSPRAQGEISNNSSGSNSDSSSVKDGNELNKSKMPLSAVEKPPTSRPMAYSDKISSSTLAPPPSASSSSMYRPPPAVPSSLSTIMTDASTGLQQPSSMASPSALSRGRIAPPYSSKPLVAEQPISDIKMDDFMASFSMVDRGIKNTAKSTAIPATASSSSTSFSSLRKVGTGSGGSSLPSAYSPSTPTLSLGGSLSSPSGQVNQMSPINSHTQSQSHYTAPQQIIQQSNLQPALQGSQMYSSLQGQIPGMGFDTGPAHASSMQFPPQGILTGIGNSSLGGIAAGGSNAGFPYQQQQQQQQQQYQQHQQYQQQQQYQQYQQNQTVGNDFSVQQPVPFTTSSSSSHVQYSPQYQNGPNAFQQAANPYPNSSLYQNPVASSMANGNGSNMPYNNNNSNNSVNKNLDPFSFLD